MIPNGTYTAVVDRIEDGLATLQIEAADGTLYDLTIDDDQLPPAARHADAILTVEIADGQPAEMTYDETATDERKEQAQDRFDRLSDRLPRDND